MLTIGYIRGGIRKNGAVLNLSELQHFTIKEMYRCEEDNPKEHPLKNENILQFLFYYYREWAVLHYRCSLQNQRTCEL